jgi:hypothetical protein
MSFHKTVDGKVRCSKLSQKWDLIKIVLPALVAKADFTRTHSYQDIAREAGDLADAVIANADLDIELRKHAEIEFKQEQEEAETLEALKRMHDAARRSQGVREPDGVN